MLTVMCGLPGSGKSTYLEEHFSTIDPEIVLCSDDFRWALTGQQYYGPAEDSVWSHVKIAARVLLKKGYHIIIDGTHLTIASRRSWIALSLEIGCDIDCMWANVAYPVTVERNRKRPRGKIVPDYVMERMELNFDQPDTEEGFSRIHLIGS